LNTGLKVKGKHKGTKVECIQGLTPISSIEWMPIGTR